MSDVFISYRRADEEWAGPLTKALEEHFDVFFDTQSIDYGEHFPTTIQEALYSCRIFLAVIGPGWVEKTSLERLRDEKNDWVQREIRIALQRRKIRIIPVMVGNTKVPPTELLPETLRPLLEQNSYPINPKKEREDCNTLIGRIEGWLTGRPPNPRGPQSPLPPVLPYLCDRIQQQEALVDFLGFEKPSHNRLVMILPGHKWEAHDGFLDRLKYRGAIDELLLAKDIGVSFCLLEWNRDKAKAGQYEDVLKRAIKRNVMQRSIASDDEMRNFFLTIKQPFVLGLQVAWSDYETCGKELFDGFIRGWQKMLTFENQTGESTVIVPPYPVVLWINFFYEERDQELEWDTIIQEKEAGLLPKLDSIARGHINEWLVLNEVKRYTSGHESKLLGLTEDEQGCCEKGRLHMLHFADAVRKILSGA